MTRVSFVVSTEQHWEVFTAISMTPLSGAATGAGEAEATSTHQNGQSEDGWTMTDPAQP